MQRDQPVFTHSSTPMNRTSARKFFSDQPLERVTDLYGVRPHIEFAEIVEAVDNS